MSSLRQALLLVLVAVRLPAQPSRWTGFTEFHAFGDSLVMRWPSLATFGDTSVVAANVFPASAMEFSGKRRLAIARVPGETLAIPDGPFVFAHPQLLTDSHGGLHLIWAEPRDDGDTVNSFMAPRVSLWHSRFTAGRWSAPNRILDGRSIGWSGDGRPVTAGSAGRIHVVVPAVLKDGQLTVTYLRLAESGAVEREFHWPGGAYASITALRGDSLLVAFSTADSLTPRRGSSTYVRLSSDAGQSWSDPAVVTRSERRPDSPPIAEQSASEFHVLWAEQRPGGSVVRDLASASPLNAWQERGSPLPLRGFPVRVVGARASCGDFVVLFEMIVGTPPNARMRVVEVDSRDKRLIEREVFPQVETAANVAIAPAGDSLRIVLSLVRPRETTMVNAISNGRACGTT